MQYLCMLLKIIHFVVQPGQNEFMKVHKRYATITNMQYEELSDDDFI